MKIKYLSDLHLEFYNPNKISKLVELIKPDLDCVLILPGDIGYPDSTSYDIFMNYVNVNFKKVFVIAGNHEFYKQSTNINETLDSLTNYFKKFNNITFLNNTIEHYEGYNFVGTILWSKITKSFYTINDTKMIKNLNIENYNDQNEVCVKFLEDTVKNLDNVIIITHHMPSYSLINEKYKKGDVDNYNQWFYSDMDKFIEQNKDKIKCWFYGHTHSANISKINNVKFLCNPIGYPGENYKVDFNLYHEL